MSDDEYEVGYGKPPVQTRFQKGRSGNPKGRPKGRRRLTIVDFEGALDRAFLKRVNVAEKGTIKNFEKLDVWATQTVNSGLKQHHPTNRLIFSHYQGRTAAAPADENNVGPTSEVSMAEIDAMLTEIAGNLSANSDASVHQSDQATDAEPAQAPDSASTEEVT